MSFSPSTLRSFTLSTQSRLFLQPGRSSSSGPHHTLLRQQHLLQHHRPYSSSPSSSPTPPPNSSSSSNSSQYSRSQFKILPFVTIFAIGTGSYVFLVKSRTGVRKPQSD